MMAYQKKTWKDRQTEHPARRKLTKTGTADVYDVTRDEGLIIDEGDPINAVNLNGLEGRIETAFADTATQLGNIATVAVHSKAGTVHSLALGAAATAGIQMVQFAATADFAEGDTWTVDGMAYTAKLQGEEGALADKYFVAGDMVSVLLDVAGAKLGFKSGGGAGLNFRVISSLTAPVSPKNNDLWVETGAPITTWSISQTEPISPINGMVWIFATSNAPYGFNVLRKNNITVYPSTCQQWVTGSWISKPLYIYLDNQWHTQINHILANNSWQVISAASKSGVSAQFWQVGDTKDITLSTGEVLTLQIYGFNHDDLSAGGKAGITFGLKNLMTAERQMNSVGTNIDSFMGSPMYFWLTDTLYNLLPQELKSEIKLVSKKTSDGNSSATIRTESMRLFFPSEAECFESISHSFAGEGSQYPIFTSNVSRIKKLPNGIAPLWWQRSPHKSYKTSFCCVASNGGYEFSGAESMRGVCFCFCV